jgi:hypothetical protein
MHYGTFKQAPSPHSRHVLRNWRLHYPGAAAAKPSNAAAPCRLQRATAVCTPWGRASHPGRRRAGPQPRGRHLGRWRRPEVGQDAGAVDVRAPWRPVPPHLHTPQNCSMESRFRLVYGAEERLALSLSVLNMRDEQLAAQLHAEPTSRLQDQLSLSASANQLSTYVCYTQASAALNRGPMWRAINSYRQGEAAGVVQLVDGLDEALAVGAATHEQPPAVVLQCTCGSSPRKYTHRAALRCSHHGRQTCQCCSLTRTLLQLPGWYGTKCL